MPLLFGYTNMIFFFSCGPRPRACSSQWLKALLVYSKNTFCLRKGKKKKKKNRLSSKGPQKKRRTNSLEASQCPSKRGMWIRSQFLRWWTSFSKFFRGGVTFVGAKKKTRKMFTDRSRCVCRRFTLKCLYFSDESRPKLIVRRARWSENRQFFNLQS